MGKLSDRVRPNSEAAPWVLEEIKKLEKQIEEAEQVLGMLESFENWDIKSRTAPNTYPFDKTGIYSRFKEYTEEYK